MADPTLRITFLELYKRVAIYLGVAPVSGGVYIAPTSTKDLDQVKQFVNDGYRRFVTENEKWNFLNAPLSIKFYPQLTLAITARSATTFTVASILGTYADDYFNGYEVAAIDATTGVESVLTITDYVGATGVFTVAATPAAIGSGDTLYVAGPRNVAGRAWRYYLPDDFYGLWHMPLTYTETGPRVRIDETTEDVIRELRAGSRTTGTPSRVAFRSVNTTAASNGNRWEAIFWPEPSITDSVDGKYKRFPGALSATTDVSVAGFHHDDTVLAAALAAAELFKNDAIGIHESTYQQRLAKSKKLDARATPATNRPYGDTSNDDDGIRRLSSDARPASYNGVPFTD